MKVVTFGVEWFVGGVDGGWYKKRLQDAMGRRKTGNVRVLMGIQRNE